MAVDRRYASTIAIFASVLFAALAIAASGLISLFADREVLAETDAGPLVAPLMFLVATAALFVQLVAAATSPGRRGIGIGRALVIGAVVYLAFLVSGATVYSLGSGRPLRGILFLASNALGPFAITVGLLAALVALLYLILISYRESGGAGRTPRWPWEDRDDRDREQRDEPP
jgi:hypothetical protein